MKLRRFGDSNGRKVILLSPLDTTHVPVPSQRRPRVGFSLNELTQILADDYYSRKQRIASPRISRW